MEPGRLVRGRFVVGRWGPPPVIGERGAVYVEDGAVRAIDSYDALRVLHPDADVVGDDSRLVMPGLVNSHSHGRGVTTLRLGIADEPGEIRSVGLRRGLGVDPYADVLLGCVRQLEAGIVLPAAVENLKPSRSRRLGPIPATPEYHQRTAPSSLRR
jgi:cytosine/adenosine deaminase-related metal-dependent hydrolase